MAKNEIAINLTGEQLDIVISILKRIVPHCAVWAFGSRVTGKARKFSDLDLAIISDEPMSLRVAADLSEAFSDSDLPFKVDVTDFSTTNEAFRKIIREHKVVLIPSN